jgi:hypothetical protein
MVRFAVFYLFYEAIAKLSISRLRRLLSLNPEVLVIPAFNVQQLVYLPMIVDLHMVASRRKMRLIGPVFHTINYMALSQWNVFRLSEKINRNLGNFWAGSELTYLRAAMASMGLRLHVDFTPMAYWNLDHVILNWFSESGKNMDFDYLIFYEPDAYTTKPLDEIYNSYTAFDASFVHYQRATPDWFFFHYPPGGRRATLSWLKKRKLAPILYRSLLGGSMFSRKALEALEKLHYDTAKPYCQGEMRLPTVLSALGFKCSKLGFQYYRYGPIWSENDVRNKAENGIFHPIRQLTREELSS